MKVESRNIYPDIADTVLEKIEIPIIDREFRDEYVRPDTIRMYVTPQQNEESDEEFKRESERTRLKQKYEHRRIDRVTRKSKNSMGQVKYTVVWTDSNTEETVPSKALQDHIDWDLVEHFEYQKAMKLAERANKDSQK